MENNLLKNIKNRSSSVRLENITKSFPSLDGHGETHAVKNINITVEDGELMTLLGPSGCGKTTTLRMVSGFETPTSGSIFIGDKDVANLPPNKRDIGMVFQSYALFPHMTVWDNVAYGLKVKHLSKEEIKKKTDEVLVLMGLDNMGGRYPNQMSGGQQQRVALARAVVCEPKVLLFDEPLSNLDAKLRIYMRDELRNIQKKLNITSIYVTHDQTEAMAISDKVLIMKDGVIMQHGTPQEIYEYPNTRFVADFIGTANFAKCKLLRKDGQKAVVLIHGDEMILEYPGDISERKENEECLLSIRPESISLKKYDGGIEGIIKQAVYYGSKIEYVVSTALGDLVVEVYDPKPYDRFAVDDKVSVSFNTSRIRLLKYEEE